MPPQAAHALEYSRFSGEDPFLTEVSILWQHAAEIARITGSGRALIELGSGSSVKTPLLLNALAPSAYVPIDISGDFLHESAAALAKRFPGLSIHPLVADFMNPFTLPAPVKSLPRVGYFAGSTIGNMTVPVAVEFLRTTARTLGEGAHLLIGIDRIKSAKYYKIEMHETGWRQLAQTGRS
jgi:uncharacterized SAM-dependent methyltransferase